MQWIYLLIAGILEIVWAVALKFSHGFSVLIPSIIATTVMILSVYFLALALKKLPLGTAYAIWTGLGTLGTVIFGIIIFNESFDIIKFLFVIMIIAGIGGLKFITKN